DQLWPGLLRDAGSLFHGILAAAEELDAHRALFGKDVQLLHALGRLADQALAADELRVHQVGAVLLAQGAEGRIAHILHGGKEEREIREYDGAYAGHGETGVGERAKLQGWNLGSSSRRAACTSDSQLFLHKSARYDASAGPDLADIQPRSKCSDVGGPAIPGHISLHRQYFLSCWVEDVDLNRT